MKISRGSTYALYGLSYLAAQPKNRLVTLAEIQSKYRISEGHLAKIFQTLVRAGVLRSTRGVNGGFALAQPPEKICPLEIIELIDGPSQYECFLHPHDPCPVPQECPVNHMWQKAQTLLIEELREKTLLDFVERRPTFLAKNGVEAPAPVTTPLPLPG